MQACILGKPGEVFFLKLGEDQMLTFSAICDDEKACEEFYVPGEKVDMQRFTSHSVVEQTTRHDMDEVNGFFEKLEAIFAKNDFTKSQVVNAIKEFIPNFEHEEKGKNLDQEM